MAVRPGQIRYLTKGKLLGAKSHQGFVDTFNWMLSWIYNFSVGPGLSLVGGRAGKPHLSLTLLNEDGAPIDDGGEDTPYEITGEGGGGGTTIPGSFEPVYMDGVLASCQNCIFCAGRTYVDAGTLTISAMADSTGYVVLTLTHPSPYATWQASNASLGIESVVPTNNSDSLTKIPLYHITNGVVDIDLRNIPTAVLAR